MRTNFPRAALEFRLAKERERLQAGFPGMVTESENDELEFLDPGYQNWQSELSGRHPLTGLKTTTRIDRRIALLIQSAILQSTVLRQFTAKQQTISSPSIFVLYRSDPEFDYKYLNLKKGNIPSGSTEDRGLMNIRQFYHRPTNKFHLRPSTNIGEAVRLVITVLSSPGFRNFFGQRLDDGLTSYLTNLVLMEQGLAPTTPEPHKDELHCATFLVAVAGLSLVAKAYFLEHSDLIRHLNTKLAIGPVGTKELARDELFKTELLSTARFAGQQIERMVSVGAIGPTSVRIWMRTDAPGIHELQIIEGSRVTRSSKINIGQAGDQTAVINYPASPNDPPLDPLKKYEYRVVRSSQERLLGNGTFETAPGRDGETPNKVVIAVTSCHQPFAADGTLDNDAARMLRLIPRILRENNVKFVLACGDQIYADNPKRLSLFANQYLIRGAVPGKKDIRVCTDTEIRRVYDMRYRMFWSMPQIREMYANYPCYPAIDDHEIKDAWGSLPEHSNPTFLKIKHGARLAYLDYQASPFLPPIPSLPPSFHYNFSYGNIGVFVMDIRSERTADARSRMFSVEQLQDLKQFLSDNEKKKVLLIVCSVPIIYTPSGLANTLAKLGRDEVLDHWATEKNKPARNALLSLLHQHQQTHPQQRVAIVSGDIHIGNALMINWKGGNKPRLYQFTSSAITNHEGRFKRAVIRIPQALASNVDLPAPCFGGRCSGEISHLPGVNAGSSHNPYTGRNLGLIEIQRVGDVSNLKFKLVGVHPTEDRQVTYFESRYLI